MWAPKADSGCLYFQVSVEFGVTRRHLGQVRSGVSDVAMRELRIEQASICSAAFWRFQREIFYPAETTAIIRYLVSMKEETRNRGAQSIERLRSFLWETVREWFLVTIFLAVVHGYLLFINHLFDLPIVRWISVSVAVSMSVVFATAVISRFGVVVLREAFATSTRRPDTNQQRNKK